MKNHQTVAQAAVLLKLSQVTVRVHIRRGNLKAEKFGRDWLIETAELERFQRERRLPGRKAAPVKKCARVPQ